MKQQMEEQTTIVVQITYKSQHQVPRHISVVPKHMADICTSEYLAMTDFWLSAKLKFIQVRVLIFPPVYFVGMHDACVCIFYFFFVLPFTKQVTCLKIILAMTIFFILHCRHTTLQLYMYFEH